MGQGALNQKLCLKTNSIFQPLPVNPTQRAFPSPASLQQMVGPKLQDHHHISTQEPEPNSHFQNFRFRQSPGAFTTPFKCSSASSLPHIPSLESPQLQNLLIQKCGSRAFQLRQAPKSALEPLQNLRAFKLSFMFKCRFQIRNPNPGGRLGFPPPPRTPQGFVSSQGQRAPHPRARTVHRASRPESSPSTPSPQPWSLNPAGASLPGGVGFCLSQYTECLGARRALQGCHHQSHLGGGQ